MEVVSKGVGSSLCRQGVIQIGFHPIVWSSRQVLKSCFDRCWGCLQAATPQGFPWRACATFQKWIMPVENTEHLSVHTELQHVWSCTPCAFDIYDCGTQASYNVQVNNVLANNVFANKIQWSKYYPPLVPFLTSQLYRFNALAFSLSNIYTYYL